MSFLRKLASGLRALFWKRQAEQEMDEELRGYLDMATKEKMAAGMGREEALRAARVELGSMEAVKEQIREVGWERAVEDLWLDLRYGLRLLRKDVSWTLVVVLTLALGIGANTAIFSVVNAALLRPLPYDHPEQLVHLWETRQRANFEQMELSHPDYVDVEAQNHVFVGLAGYNGTSFTLTGRGDPERITALRVTSNFFSLLGVKPYLGRFFGPDEAVAGGPRVVVLSYGLWQRRFGGDRTILGQTLILTGQPYTVVGVLPRDFEFLVRPRELYTAPYMNDDQKTRRNFYWLNTIARLNPGATVEEAQLEMDTIAARLAAEYPDSNTGGGLRVVPLREQILGSARKAILVLLGAVGFLLLIACANVANLLLARASGRGKEMAIRAALGAGRLRLVRQLLVESVLLASIGGAAGLLWAYWGVDLLLTLIPENLRARVPYLEYTAIDGSVLAFTVAVSIATGVLFGLAPALRTARLSVQDSLREGGGTSRGSASHRVPSALVVTEVALALMLLVATGLFVQSLYRLFQVDPGFNKENLLTLRVSIPATQYPEQADVVNFYRQVREQVAALPGVKAVGLTGAAPFTGDGGTVYLYPEGRPPKPGIKNEAVVRDVSPGYFEALGIPLLAGRTFTERDDAGKAPLLIVSRMLARQIFANEDPVGQLVVIPVSGMTWEVAGVVGDVSLASLDTPLRPVLYTCNLQDSSRSTDLVVRGAGDPRGLLGPIRNVVHGLNKDVPVFGVATMDELMLTAPSIFQRRALAVLLATFAALALVLAAVGILGVISYSVSRQTHEIGIRMALGAQRGDILRLVVGQGIRLTAAGVFVGLAGAFVVARFLRSLLFGVNATNPLTFAGVAILLGAVALAACYVPARRAARVDPMVALRYE